VSVRAGRHCCTADGRAGRHRCRYFDSAGAMRRWAVVPGGVRCRFLALATGAAEAADGVGAQGVAGWWGLRLVGTGLGSRGLRSPAARDALLTSLVPARAYGRASVSNEPRTTPGPASDRCSPRARRRNRHPPHAVLAVVPSPIDYTAAGSPISPRPSPPGPLTGTTRNPSSGKPPQPTSSSKSNAGVTPSTRSNQRRTTVAVGSGVAAIPAARPSPLRPGW
jgi:hypothetical protein